MMQEYHPGMTLEMVAFMPTIMAVHQPLRFGILLKCSTCQLLVRAAFMLHNDNGYTALKHYAALKGLAPREQLVPANQARCPVPQSACGTNHVTLSYLQTNPP